MYYALISKSEEIDSFYRGSSLQHPHMGKVLDLTIPVPPIPVQEEIIKILDKFTELTAELAAELTAELTARQAQYDYYRDKLLTFKSK